MRAGGVTVLLAVLAVALLALPLALSLPSHPVYFGVINNVAHAPVFGALAIVILTLLRSCTAWPEPAKYAVALAAAVAAGGLIELVQPWIGRGAQLHDLWTDTLGAVAGLALASAVTGPRRLPGLLVAIVAMAVVSIPLVRAVRGYLERERQFPTVLDFTSTADWYFVRLRGVHVETGALPARWRRDGDPPALKLRIVGGRWPGITHFEPQPDWRGYARLNLDLLNPGARTLTLTLRVHDLAHDNSHGDRFNRTFTLAPGVRRVVTVPLSEIARGPERRALDLGRVAGLILYAGSEPDEAGRECYLTRIWLE